MFLERKLKFGKESSHSSYKITHIIEACIHASHSHKKGDVGMAKHLYKSTETRDELSITLYLQLIAFKIVFKE